MSGEAPASSPPPHVQRLQKESGEERAAPHRLLIEYLKECREQCPSCRYDLHNLTSPRCPECGEALILRVGLEQPRLGALITGVIGLASGLGFSGLALGWGLWMMMTNRFGPRWEELTILFTECVVTLTLILLWLRAGRRVRRMSPPARWLLSLLCFAVPIANLLFFLAFVD